VFRFPRVLLLATTVVVSTTTAIGLPSSIISALRGLILVAPTRAVIVIAVRAYIAASIAAVFFAYRVSAGVRSILFSVFFIAVVTVGTAITFVFIVRSPVATAMRFIVVRA
jgi:signal transduction histidine kinase